MLPLPQETAHASTGLMHALFGLVTTSVGWILLGTGLLIGGLIWGSTSHQVSYIAGNRGAYNVFLDSGFIYFQQEQTNNYYVINTVDFSPSIAGVIDSSSLIYTPGQPNVPSLVYVPGKFTFIARNDTIHVNYSGVSTIINFAHPIEQITLNGTVYTSDEYLAFPHGYMINNWPYAGSLMGLGAVFIGFSIFFLLRRRKRQKLAVAAERAAIDAIPSPFARELAEKTRQTNE